MSAQVQESDHALTIAEIKDLLPVLWAANVSAVVQGAPGVGKTQGVRQACEEDGRWCEQVTLSAHAAVDLKGIPSIGTTSEGTPCTVFTPPDFLVRLNERAELEGPGCIVFEEFANAGDDVRKAAFQLLLEHALDNFRLALCIAVCATTNRKQDGCNVRELSAAIRTGRAAIFDARVDQEGWVRWARPANIDERIIGAIRWNSGEVQGEDESARTLLHSFSKDVAGVQATPRGWEQLSNVLRETDDVRIIGHAANSLVGTKASATFVSFLKVYAGLPDVDSIRNFPLKAEVPEQSELNVRFALVNRLSNVATLKDVGAYLKYFARFGAGEFEAKFVSDVLAKHDWFSASPEYTKWAIANPAFASA